MNKTPNIPMIDLKQEAKALWPRLSGALERIIKSGEFIGGKEVLEFESEVSAYLNTKHAVTLNSGTDALVISLKALGIGPGDEVIVPSFTFFATAEAVSIVGAIPVFADVSLEDFLILPSEISRLVTHRTKAVIPVHLFGQCAAIKQICEISKKAGIQVIEDVAQAFGSKFEKKFAGTFGKINAFSFFPSKNLGGYGDGGMLVTEDDSLAEIARALRSHGAKKKYFNEYIGYNSRLDAIQAAILRVKLETIDRDLEERRKKANRYYELLSNISSIQLPNRSEKHTYNQFTIRVTAEAREGIQRHLQQAGIATQVYYPIPLHKLPPYATRTQTALSNAELLSKTVLSLPISAGISDQEQVRVVNEITEYLATARAA